MRVKLKQNKSVSAVQFSPANAKLSEPLFFPSTWSLLALSTQVLYFKKIKFGYAFKVLSLTKFTLRT